MIYSGTMPSALFAGLFIGFGSASVEDNRIASQTLFLFRDPRTLKRSENLGQVTESTIVNFIEIQWAVFAIMVVISQTIDVIDFPGIFFSYLYVYFLVQDGI